MKLYHQQSSIGHSSDLFVYKWCWRTQQTNSVHLHQWWVIIPLVVVLFGCIFGCFFIWLSYLRCNLQLQNMYYYNVLLLKWRCWMGLMNSSSKRFLHKELFHNKERQQRRLATGQNSWPLTLTPVFEMNTVNWSKFGNHQAYNIRYTPMGF